jgi:hypothetical protein
MSIATVSVLRRILDDVRRSTTPAPPPVVARIEGDALVSGERLWVFETDAVGRAPYASALHFWAHGLAAHLEACGAEQYFDAVAGSGLCDAGCAGDAARALSRACGARLRWEGPFYETYRMVDQPVFQSFVGESRVRYRAFFWQEIGWAESEFCQGVED